MADISFDIDILDGILSGCADGGKTIAAAAEEADRALCDCEHELGQAEVAVEEQRRRLAAMLDRAQKSRDAIRAKRDACEKSGGAQDGNPYADALARAEALCERLDGCRAALDRCYDGVCELKHGMGAKLTELAKRIERADGAWRGLTGALDRSVTVAHAAADCNISGRGRSARTVRCELAELKKYDKFLTDSAADMVSLCGRICDTVVIDGWNDRVSERMVGDVSETCCAARSAVAELCSPTLFGDRSCIDGFIKKLDEYEKSALSYGYYVL